MIFVHKDNDYVIYAPVSVVIIIPGIGLYLTRRQGWLNVNLSINVNS